MENSLFVKDPEIVKIINRHTLSIYKHCVTALGADAYAQRMVIAGIGAEANKPPVIWPNVYKTGVVPPLETTSFPLWTDFWKLLRCDWCKGTVVQRANDTGVYWTTPQNNVNWCPMQRVEMRTGVIDDSPREWATGIVGYWLRGMPGSTTTIDVLIDTTTSWWISFLPPPASAVSVCIWYIPVAPSYTAQDDSNLIKLPGEAWEYVLNSTAAELLEKQGRDPSARRAAAADAKGDLLTSNLVVDDENAWGTIDINGSQAPHGRRKNVWGP